MSTRKRQTPRPRALAVAAALALAATAAAQDSWEQAMADYDFPLAERLINAEMARLRRRGQPTGQAEESLRLAGLAQRQMSAVERVLVFDSLAAPRARALELAALCPECGRLAPTDSMPGLPRGGALFMPQAGDRIVFSAPTDPTGERHLYTANIVDGRPQDIEPIAGLPGQEQHNPCMMADGLTLYFAARGAADALGGWDIYMTRYDPDLGRFLAAENVGMPFNSPDDDLLLCIDEEHNLGTLATARRQPADTVCLYYFAPNASRRVYLEEETGPETLRQLARLGDISLTWGTQEETRQALARLDDCRHTAPPPPPPGLTLVIAPGRVCHSPADLRSPQAAALARQWTQDTARLAQEKERLAQMRQAYAQASPAQRQAMRPAILRAEQDTEALAQALRQQEKDIRRAELGL